MAASYAARAYCFSPVTFCFPFNELGAPRLATLRLRFPVEATRPHNVLLNWLSIIIIRYSIKKVNINPPTPFNNGGQRGILPFNKGGDRRLLRAL